MSATRNRQSSAQSNRRKRSTPTSSASSARRRPATQRSKASAKSGASKSSSRSSNDASSRARQRDNAPRQKVLHVVVPAVSGALGVAGGVALGRKTVARSPELFGMRLPSVNIDLGEAGKHLAELGRRLGSLVGEIQAVREKAEKVGQAIS